jgi:hypothetical protein
LLEAAFAKNMQSTAGATAEKPEAAEDGQQVLGALCLHRQFHEQSPAPEQSLWGRKDFFSRLSLLTGIPVRARHHGGLLVPSVWRDGGLPTP